MLKWQQTFDVWGEKTKRAVNRGLLKVPLFSSKPDNLTIYEFEKEFITYKKVAALSVRAWGSQRLPILSPPRGP
jgi:hypothetical protein